MSVVSSLTLYLIKTNDIGNGYAFAGIAPMEVNGKCKRKCEVSSKEGYSWQTAWDNG